ncbi:MAG: metallophosphoesterase [Haliea sp.]|nr:MAG: metallophosphoesterase [Haliea sp.]
MTGTKYAVLSDIHGNLTALEAVLADVARQGVERILNLGDILSGPIQPAETADFLMARDFITIAGNHERQLLQARAAQVIDPLTSDGYAAMKIGASHAAWIASIPASHWLEEDVLMVHGTPGSDLVYWLETVTQGMGIDGSRGMREATADEVSQRLASGSLQTGGASLVLCGHTHIPRAVQCGATLIVNPGSVGLQAYEDAHPHPHRTENGSPHARYALVERGNAGWSVDHRAIAYDWHAPAQLAAANGRPDWAYALTTGRTLPAVATIAP